MKMYNKPVIEFAEVEDVITTSGYLSTDKDASKAFQAFLSANSLNTEAGKYEEVLVFEW